MEIRDATPRDNDALVALTRLTPMEGVMTLYIDRSPDFFALNRMQGDRYEVLVGVEDGKIISVLSTCWRQARFMGREILMSYGGDLKVDPDYQNLGVAKKMNLEMMFRDRGFKADVGTGLIIHGNVKPRRFVRGYDKFPMFMSAGHFNVYQFPTYYFDIGSRTYEIRRAKTEDLAEIVSLLDNQYRDYNFSPVFSEESFAKELQSTPGYTIDDILVATRGGRLAACLGLWDQSAIKRFVVMEYKAWMKAGLLLTRVLEKVAGTPRMPSAGEPLKEAFVRHLACAPCEEGAIRVLVRKAVAEARRRGLNMVSVSFHESDPLSVGVKGMFKIGFLTELFAINRTDMEITPEILQQKPTYWDFSLA